jgi:predicted glutamine amidotransferase
MCQLLGMNCNVPTDICFSFRGFHQRAGVTGDHADGFGIAFFEGAGCRVFIDGQAAVDSPIASLVAEYPIRSMNVIAHIRKATKGEVALVNTHPFVRELWGRYWIFAHNGDLENFSPETCDPYRPVGTTDSEAAFCLMLRELRARFPEGEPPLAELQAALRELSAGLSAHGTFNYMLSNGEYLFAHCSTRLAYIVREAPFTVAHLKDQDVAVDFSEVTTPDDRVVVIATEPLTDNEAWTSFAPGELIVFHHGAPLSA